MALGDLIDNETISSSTPQLSHEIRSELMDVRDKCFSHFSFLVKRLGIAEEIFKESEITSMVSKHLLTCADELKEFLGEDGQFFIAMNSAEQFADQVLGELSVNNNVHKIKISTYSESISSGKDLDDATKEIIRQEMNIVPGQPILILEDMIDTGNTLDRLVAFLESLGAKVKILCLFDKEIDINGKTSEEREKTRKIKERLGEKLDCIKKVGNEFIIGSGIDYSHRLLAEILGMFKIHPEYIDFFIDEMRPYIDKVTSILENRKKTP